MFGIGMTEVLFILAIALIVLGPKKLPELAKTLGKAFGEFRRSVNDLKASVEIDQEPDHKIDDKNKVNIEKIKVSEDDSTGKN